MKVISGYNYMLVKEVVVSKEGLSFADFSAWKDLESEDEDSYFILKPDAVMYQTPKGKLVCKDDIIGLIENVEI